MIAINALGLTSKALFAEPFSTDTLYSLGDGFPLPECDTGRFGLTLNFDSAIGDAFEIVAPCNFDLVALLTLIVFLTSPLVML